MSIARDGERSKPVRMNGRMDWKQSNLVPATATSQSSHSYADVVAQGQEPRHLDSQFDPLKAAVIF